LEGKKKNQKKEMITCVESDEVVKWNLTVASVASGVARRRRRITSVQPDEAD
jgi:hypothetical protein